MLMQQVSVVPRDQYIVPEGQRIKEGSRKCLRCQKYPPRAQLREQAAAELAKAVEQAMAEA